MPGAGIIVMWSGNLNHIPPGWTLCDGTFGTPDLRERFIKGTPDSVDPGGTGGDTTHDHDWTDPGHHHNLGPGSEVQSGANLDNQTEDATPSGTTMTADNEPPYYNLAFVMKL